MRKIISLLIPCLLFFLIVCVYAQQQPAAVYVIPVKGTIDLGLASYIDRAIHEAEAAGCSTVIFEIDTLGGRVDAALKIKDAVMDSNMNTVAFINKRAISAGALISIACKNIYMAPGGTVGAAKPVQCGIGGCSTEQPTDEKTVSFLRKEFKSTAEKNGHPPVIAEAFVDQDLEIEGLNQKGKLLTLTTEEALTGKFARAQCSSLDELLKQLNLQTSTIVRVKPLWSENLVRFLTNPVVSSLLLTIGIIGIAIELKAPGISLPGILGTLSILIFFFGQYLVGLAHWIDLAIFAAGIGLLLLEICVIPGFGITGISGIVLVFAGIFLALVKRPLPGLPIPEHDIWNALYIIGSSLVVGTTLTAVLFRYVLPRTEFMSGIILKHDEKSATGYVSSGADLCHLVGTDGTAGSQLRPAGKGIFNDMLLDVVTEGGLIEKGARIRILKIEGSRIVVKEI
jgi:membrane-bound serine protease (ClpP class)